MNNNIPEPSMMIHLLCQAIFFGDQHSSMKFCLFQDYIDRELCSLLGIDLHMKEEVIEEHKAGMEEQEEGIKVQEDVTEQQEEVIEELKEMMEEQEGILDEENKGIKEQEKTMEEQGKKIMEEKVEEVTTHDIKYGIAENILFDSIKDAALEVKLFDKGPKVGAKKRGRPKKISFDRDQPTKTEFMENPTPKKMLK